MKVIIGIVLFFAGFCIGFFYAALLAASKRGKHE